MNLGSGRRGTESVDVVVVGAGQAGLAVSYYLRSFGIEHVVLERGSVGESWRSARWDSFTLVTPNWMTRLPGYTLAEGTGANFISRDAVVVLLERFAAGLPVTEHVDVLSVRRDGDRYLVSTPAREFSARAVVIAGGGQRVPVIPGLAARLTAGLHQCDAARYRNPASLPAGAVLVVGSGQSGAQIAEELAAAGREVLLATSRVARVPRRYRDRDVHEWSVELGLYDKATASVTDLAEFREANPTLSGGRGGHTLALQQLARGGVRLLGRLADAEDTKLTFAPDLAENMRYADQRAAAFRRAIDSYVASAGIVAAPPDTDPAEMPLPDVPDGPLTLDVQAERIAAVVWCTGFGPDTTWVNVPILRADGFPVHNLGAAADGARIAQHIAAKLKGNQTWTQLRPLCTLR